MIPKSYVLKALELSKTENVIVTLNLETGEMYQNPLILIDNLVNELGGDILTLPTKDHSKVLWSFINLYYGELDKKEVYLLSDHDSTILMVL